MSLCNVYVMLIFSSLKVLKIQGPWATWFQLSMYHGTYIYTSNKKIAIITITFFYKHECYTGIEEEGFRTVSHKEGLVTIHSIVF